jgi:hypothetical protein
MVYSVINTRLDDEEMAGLQDSAEVIQGRNCRSPTEARGSSFPQAQDLYGLTLVY